MSLSSINQSQSAFFTKLTPANKTVDEEKIKNSKESFGALLGSGEGATKTTPAAAIASKPAAKEEHVKAVPDVADFNGDGLITEDDRDNYISAYFNGSQGGAVDINNDGNVDPDDLSDYITAYFDAVSTGRAFNPADFNNDGSVTQSDMTAYTEAYFSGSSDKSVDFNNDGNLDPDDLSDYIGAYFEANPSIALATVAQPSSSEAAALPQEEIVVTEGDDIKPELAPLPLVNNAKPFAAGKAHLAEVAPQVVSYAKALPQDNENYQEFLLKAVSDNYAASLIQELDINI